jgi:hypothetical protein
MGREIRKVPANYEHPTTSRNGVTDFQPMRDQTFESAVQEWKEGFAQWEAGRHPHQREGEFWECWDAPPERESYRTFGDEEATWFQVYETVSEGTPVTPPFATKEELVDYLVKNGDFWGKGRSWSRANAEAFVAAGFAPSFVVDAGGLRSGVEAAADQARACYEAGNPQIRDA